MVWCAHYRGAIGAFNIHIQVECVFVDDVTPSLANMRELAPQKSLIPKVFIIQPIEIEYVEEYIIIEPMNGRVLYIASSLGCWRR
jgi:hypothetical protein